MERIAGYRITGVLGEGGMSIVYSASDATGTPVAIKVLRREVYGDHARRRFLHEIAAVHALRHPTLPRVHEWGETPEGGLYYVMESLEGEDLEARLIRRGALPPEEVARIGNAVARGLGVAHRAGLVHRDVKPGNVFLARDGSVRILDFGLALGLDPALAVRLTSANMLLGTPSYMAVEQANGSREEDPRTDVWGLGATLYHAVSGRTPFDAPTPMGELVRIVTDDPDPLPDATPSWLAAAIERCIRKDRGARWPSMGALAEALVPSHAIGGARPGTRTPLPAPLPDEVRIVSVLLADGATQPELFAANVRLEGGVPHALVGGRAVGLFGGEAWRGDEATRAVRAALMVRASEPSALLGVATGRAVLAWQADSAWTRTGITGAVVAGAEAVLAPVGVGADAETLRRIHGGFAVDGSHVLARRPGADVIGVRGIGGADLPILGRDREIRHMELALSQVLGEGQAEGLLLIGPAGIGKSRLLHELRRLAEDRAPGVVRLEARAEAQRALQGWHPISAALRSKLEAPEGTPPEILRERLLALAPSRRCAEFVGELVGAEFPPSPALEGARASPRLMHDRIVIALGDLVESLTRAGPVVLTIEDLHWADGPTIEALEILLRRLADRPLLVVGAARPELEAPLHEFRRLPLGGISRQSTRALVLAVLGRHADIDSIAEAIFERSGGNPYFVEELALGVRAGRHELPPSVEAAVQARLDALPRRDKDLLRRASVLGRRFWLPALVELGDPRPQTAIDRLHRQELVAPGHGTRTAEWRFRHAIVQEVAYASLTEAQRATMHRIAGRWLAAQPRGRAAEVARHLEIAGDPKGAAPYWLRAAKEAFREGDAPLALEASGHALERFRDGTLSPPATTPSSRRIGLDTEFGVRLMRCDILHFLGRLRESEAEIEPLFEIAANDDQIVEAVLRRARVLRQRGRYRAAIATLAEGLARAPGDVRLLIEDALAKVQWGRAREGLRTAESALEAAQAEGRGQELGIALAAVGYCRAMLGELGRGRALIGPATAALKESGNPRIVAEVRSLIAYGSLIVGRPDAALRQLEAARQSCRSVGNWLEEAWLLPNLALARARTDDLAGAWDVLQLATARASQIEDPRLRIHCLLRRGQILVETREWSSAEPVLAEALGCDEEAQGYLAPLLNASYGSVLVALGRKQAARKYAERALALRDDAGGILEGEAEVFLLAHAVGIPGALARGWQELDESARGIGDASLERSFLQNVPSHARLAALAKAAGLGRQDGADR